MFGDDSNFEIGQGSGGLKGIGGSKLPMPDKSGKGEGGPSKRKPFAKKNPFRPSLAHQKSSASSSPNEYNTKTPFPPGAGKKSGLNAI